MKTGVIFWLMVWNMNFIFPSIGNVIIPTDELHNFFRGVGQPPTSCRFSLEICQVPSDVTQLAAFAWDSQVTRNEMPRKKICGHDWTISGWWFGTFYIFPYIG
jgi:hypothetical protein